VGTQGSAGGADYHFETFDRLSAKTMPTHPQPAPVPPARPGSPLRRVGSEAGFSLIEVLVSALMVILIASAAATALIATGQFSGNQRSRSQADALASQDQERLRGLSDQQLSGLNQTLPVSLNGSTFSVHSTATYLDTTGASSCTSSTAAYYKIASTVTWTDSLSNQPASIAEESLLTRPVAGDLLTQATDQTGTPLPGVGINAAGASNQTGTTDANGCVLFAGLTPGAYTVALTPPAGDVDLNGNSAPTGTATVTTTSTATTLGNVFHFGPAGSIVGTFTSSTAGAAGEADGLSWLGGGSPFVMTGGFQVTPLTAPSAPQPTFTTRSLFPFAFATTPVTYTNNYTVWGGRCAGQAPPGVSPVNPDQFTVSPGSLNQAHSIQEPLLDLVVTNGTSNIKPTHVKLTYITSAGGCTDFWTPTISTAAVGAMPATGWLANPGQPYAPSGTLTVCADTGSHKNSVTTSNTNFTAANVVTVPITTISGTC
jgi:Tfp pilus assembly protein PilV